MKPDDLYAERRMIVDSNRKGVEPVARPISVTHDVGQLYGAFYNHIPEIDDTLLGTIPNGANKRITLRLHRLLNARDSRNIWLVGSVWLDDAPFMVIQNAGREGDDFSRRFITDFDTYVKAVRYLWSLTAPCEVIDDSDVVDPNEDIPELMKFHQWEFLVFKKPDGDGQPPRENELVEKVTPSAVIKSTKSVYKPTKPITITVE